MQAALYSVVSIGDLKKIIAAVETAASQGIGGFASQGDIECVVLTLKPAGEDFPGQIQFEGFRSARTADLHRMN